MRSEKEVTEQFGKVIAKLHPSWSIQTELELKDTRGQKYRADGCVIEKDAQGIVLRVVAYFESKGEDADARDTQTGYAQCLMDCDLTGSEAWLVLVHEQAEKFLSPDRRGKLDGRVKVFDLDEETLLLTQSVVEQKGKSRMKQRMETPLFTGWSQEYEIVITTPLALTTPIFNSEGNIVLNTGMRVRGSLKEVAKTISGTLSDSLKYTLYCSPEQSIIGKKEELIAKTKFIPDPRSGASAKREYYELPPPRHLKFTINCMNPKVTPQICEELIRKAGMFAGIGDSHSDGEHGRFRLVEVTSQ